MGAFAQVWNDLGWADPFSSAAHTSRQERHARALASPIYTPQLVVNGREELLGCSQNAADAAIARALDTKPLATLSVDAGLQPLTHRLELDWHCDTNVEARGHTSLELPLVVDPNRARWVAWLEEARSGAALAAAARPVIE